VAAEHDPTESRADDRDGKKWVMGKEISASRCERIRMWRHWHCSYRVGAVSGSMVRVRWGCARLWPRSVCAGTMEKTVRWVGPAGRWHGLGPASVGVGLYC
jgi:hypothetical protein